MQRAGGIRQGMNMGRVGGAGLRAFNYYTKETTEITDDVTFYSKCRNQWKRLETILFRIVISYIEMYKSQLLSQIPEITIKNEERSNSQ